jgi:hypothetical protein
MSRDNLTSFYHHNFKFEPLDLDGSKTSVLDVCMHLHVTTHAVND